MIITHNKQTRGSIKRTISMYTHWHQVSTYRMSQKSPTLSFSKSIEHFNVFSGCTMCIYFKEKKNLKTMSITFLTKLTWQKEGGSLDILPGESCALQRQSLDRNWEKTVCIMIQIFYFFEVLWFSMYTLYICSYL